MVLRKEEIMEPSQELEEIKNDFWQKDLDLVSSHTKNNYKTRWKENSKKIYGNKYLKIMDNKEYILTL